MKNSKRSGRKSKPSAAATPGGDAETIDGLLARLGVHAWDFLIVGDGSGSTWKRGAGWASVSVERETGERLLWAGGSNRGTVNFAEAMAYLTPLEHFAARELDRRENGGETRAYNVHIVTDSEYCRNTGRAGVGVGKNAGVWAAFTAFLRRGFVLHWHWMGRGGCDLNIYCDAVSKMVRRGVEGYNLSAGLCVDGAVTTPYDVNP